MSLLLDLIFPVKCLSCSVSDYYLCPQCFSKLKRHSLKGDTLSLYRYQSPLIELLSSLKYDFVTHLVPQLVNQMYLDLSSDFPNLLSYWQRSSFVLIKSLLYKIIIIFFHHIYKTLELKKVFVHVNDVISVIFCNIVVEIFLAYLCKSYIEKEDYHYHDDYWQGQG